MVADLDIYWLENSNSEWELTLQKDPKIGRTTSFLEVTGYDNTINSIKYIKKLVS